MKELESQKAALERTLDLLLKSTDEPINRNDLLKILKRDALALYNYPEKKKEIVHKYVAKIIISDDSVEVTAIGDIDRERYSGKRI